MRNITCLFWMCLISITTFSQKTASEQEFSKEQFLKKSKSKTQTAWALLTTGVTFLGIGAVMANEREEGFTMTKQMSGLVMIIAGAGLSLAGAASFEKAKKYKRRAAELGFRMEKVNYPDTQGYAQTAIPALGLKISL